MIGSVSGVLGAGGAFILVPVMLSILKIPVRMTIASSLAITFLSAIGASTGKILTGQVMLLPAVVLMAASLIAALIGAKVDSENQCRLLTMATCRDDYRDSDQNLAGYILKKRPTGKADSASNVLVFFI